MAMPLRLASLSFNGGSIIQTADVDVVVLVGPNNCGKSRTLQELLQTFQMQPRQPRNPDAFFVLDDFEVEMVTLEQLESWLRANRYTYVEPTSQQTRIRTAAGGDVQLGDALPECANPKRMPSLHPHLVRWLSCGERLGHLSAAPRLGLGQHPDQPVQTLVADPAKLRLFDRAFHSAFGRNVIVDAWGQNVQLRVSADTSQDDLATTSSTGIADPDTMKRFESLPLIDTQSDGVRSFTGILLTLLTTTYPLVLIDEPEAFLHPPQARLLGRFLGALRYDGQLVVATHSLDILLGLLEGEEQRTMVARLTRRDDKTTALPLAPDRVETLWKDPLLRFSRAFDGLFHEGVVVCEGDTDSQFYSAIARHVARAGVDGDVEGADDDTSPLMQALSEDAFDVMFTYAGGKHRMALIGEALRAVDVPVRLIVDFDALNDRQVLTKLVNAVGGTYTDEMEHDRGIVDAHLRGSDPKPTVDVLRAQIAAVLGDDDTAPVTSAMVAQVRSATELSTGWANAKRSGRAGVPAGDATTASNRLLLALAKTGVHVVPTGAVESFVRVVGNKGPKWVIEVIERGLIAEASDAHDFVRGVLATFRRP